MSGNQQKPPAPSSRSHLGLPILDTQAECPVMSGIDRLIEFFSLIPRLRSYLARQSPDLPAFVRAIETSSLTATCQHQHHRRACRPPKPKNRPEMSAFVRFSKLRASRRPANAEHVTGEQVPKCPHVSGFVRVIKSSGSTATRQRLPLLARTGSGKPPNCPEMSAFVRVIEISGLTAISQRNPAPSPPAFRVGWK